MSSFSVGYVELVALYIAISQAISLYVARTQDIAFIALSKLGAFI